ncbi:unnamed protein product, partial [Rotaria sp. Silwood1]
PAAIHRESNRKAARAAWWRLGLRQQGEGRYPGDNQQLFGARTDCRPQLQQFQFAVTPYVGVTGARCRLDKRRIDVYSTASREGTPVATRRLEETRRALRSESLRDVAVRGEEAAIQRQQSLHALRSHHDGEWRIHDANRGDPSRLQPKLRRTRADGPLS